ncbi:M20 family metallo-hydrolase [Streptomyces sp. NPDC089919]|uniref:M20 family metallo-hydrolase n=1 Tax=Streptomyces sp. NPDC089919 TaxID=3155188 RepID=UPI00342AAD45
MTETLIPPLTAPLRTDGGRLLRRIRELGAIGADPATGGITRPGFGPADQEARDWLLAEARAAGLSAGVDAAGNVIMRRPPADGDEAAAPRPAVLMGSHLDTVVNGGPLDGAYGVLAALEVLQRCAETGLEAPYEPVAVGFANEEGALFPQPFWGSMALAGRLAELPGEPADHHGRPLRGPLEAAGGNLDALGTAAWSAGSVAAYLELHIEQGPVLERAGAEIGVVEAITGRCVLTLSVRGAAGHSGTTPMEGRRDAMAAAARVVAAAEEIGRGRGLCRVATVGRLEAHPNTPNTIAGSVTLTVDLRDTDPVRLRTAEAALRTELERIAGESGCGIAVTALTRSEPVATHPPLRAAIEDGCAELGLSHLALPSGAGHDAQIVADIAPIAMVFVPSIGGVSHVPQEATRPEHLVAGADVLLHVALHALGHRGSGHRVPDRAGSAHAPAAAAAAR